MKHVFSVLSVTCIAFFTIFLSTTNTGCKKGDDGAKGDTGTANVMYSSWLDVNFDPAVNTAGDTVAWTAEITAPKITKTILDSGTVKVYLNAGTAASPAIFPLPIADFYYALTGVENLNLYFTVGTINLYATQDASTFTSSGAKSWQYRYVIIPGGVHTGRSAVNWNNYEAVKDFYNIPD
ncbi:hypothetical protein FAM09_08445 [Niastella caeni]|uniref:Uncharacterized protein n=1 Tax=Niastella caeni TaxID=2569763 RepID=A0A4S8I0C1_9BACT|nr:hypothetical protein [Niastella caeni]THU39914.1 hypothetical protein FAM09_08445 [Niastella caeni]